MPSMFATIAICPSECLRFRCCTREEKQFCAADPCSPAVGEPSLLARPL